VTSGSPVGGPADGTRPVPASAPDLTAVRAMLEARTVAVVGASARPDSFGHQLLVEITSGDPAIKAYPVNPRYDEIRGLPCLPSLAAVLEGKPS